MSCLTCPPPPTHTCQVLVQVYEKGEEVPLIAMYRKELVGELLVLRQEDVPETTREQEWERFRSGDFKLNLYKPGVMQPELRKTRRWACMCVRGGGCSTGCSRDKESRAYGIMQPQQHLQYACMWLGGKIWVIA